MTINELGQELKRMYDDAPKGEKVTFIHLFGIKYFNEIKKVGVRQVIEQSGMHSSYYIEVSKGVKLAKHVTAKA